MPLPGGAADKFGNRYEGRWTVSCILDVMAERADSIWLEPPGPEGEGAEFRVRKGNTLEYHQAKRQHTSGRWTLSNLEQVKVLSRFAEKLKEPNAQCFFVSGNDAYQIHELSERAKGSASWEEFDSVFLQAKEQRKAFEQLCRSFADSREVEAYSYLKRITIVTTDETFLRATVENRMSALVEGDPGVVADVLAQLALDQVHHELTATDIWKHLEEAGFHRRRWDQDPRVLEAVEEANKRYLDSLRAQAIGGIVLPRDEVQKAYQILNVPGGKTGVLLVGEAGVGKSGVMFQVVEMLLTDGTPVVAFRADRLQPAQLADKIGEQLGLPGSPANVLAAVAQGRDCVLVIDQLDALSLASGRNSEVFDCIEEIVRQVKVHSNMRILIACRKFDLDNDHRLRSLSGNDGIADTVIINRLSHDTVREVVSTLGLDTKRLNARQLDLLSVPLHLKLLSELTADEHIRALNFVKGQDLYERFWHYKQWVIERERLGRPVRWTNVIYALSDYMHQHQTLSAPEAVVDEWSNDADAMTSENVLVCDGKQYSFFHEGFFDYVYARRFAGGSQKLLTLLLGDEQHLFRRAQVRQILLYMREAEFARYVTDLGEVLSSPDVRFHLKKVVFAVLGGLSSPDTAEWDVLSQFIAKDPDDHCRRQVWFMLRTSDRWFQLVDSLGLVEKWLANSDETLVDQAVWLLSGVQRQLADRVAELLEPYVGVSERWNNRFRYVAQWAELSQGRRFLELFLRLIDEGILDEAKGPIAVNSDFWSLLYLLRTQRPAWASEIIGHYFNRRLKLSNAAGQPNPFDDKSGTIPDSQSDDAVLVESARGAPEVFIKEVLPFMVKVMDANAERDGDPPWPDRVWYYRIFGGGYGIDGALINGMETALCELAKGDPKSFGTLAEPLRDSPFETAQFLMIRGLTANGGHFADEAVDYLCENPKRLAMGYLQNSHWASGQLIESVSPYCCDEKLRQLEQLLLEYSRDRSDQTTEEFDYAQFILLSAITVARRSEQVSNRLVSMRQKFGDQAPEPPSPIMTMWVGPPIPDDEASEMTDEQWLLAISKYSSEEIVSKQDGRLVGGARELANLLENHVRQDPQRFTELVLKFPDDTNHAYFEAVLRAITKAGLDIETVLKVCDRCHRISERPFGRWICDPIGNLAEDMLPPEALELVAWYATKDLDPDQELWRTQTTSGDVYYSGDILTNGINTARGTGAGAIAKLISHDANRIDNFRPALEMMVRDSSIAVRSCVAQALLAVLRHDRDLAVRLFQQLCDTEDALLQTHYVERFLYFALQTHFQALSKILDRMVNSEIPEVATVGARQACLASLELEEARPIAELCLSGTDAQRIGAAQVLAANVRTATYRSFCEDSLVREFDDAHEDVRTSSSECFRHFEKDQLGEYGTLIEQFVDSRAFADHYSQLLHALEQTTAKIPEVTLLACERFIEITGSEAADISTRHAGEVNNVIQLTMRAYQQSSDKAGTARSLDLIDRLMELGVYGIDKALENFER